VCALTAGVLQGFPPTTETDGSAAVSPPLPSSPRAPRASARRWPRARATPSAWRHVVAPEVVRLCQGTGAALHPPPTPPQDVPAPLPQEMLVSFGTSWLWVGAYGGARTLMVSVPRWSPFKKGVRPTDLRCNNSVPPKENGRSIGRKLSPHGQGWAVRGGYGSLSIESGHTEDWREGV